MLESTEVIVKDEDLLKYVNKNSGILWERIAMFKNQLRSFAGAMEHKAGEPQSDEMKEAFPLKQTLEGGLYTRELFMPKGSVVVSMIHKQQHPSFLLSGRVSYLNDTGELVTISGPHVIFTQIGTQRVLYIHEDTNWCCVYKTDAKTFEEAEADVYTDDYRDLPDTIIIQKTKLCLE
jgi:hypothetical protein